MPVALTQYPEFIVAAFLGIAVLFQSSNREGFQWPHWMAEIAKSVILALPDRYILWVQKYLIFAGWRSNLAFGNFACSKLYVPLAILALAFFVPLNTVLVLCALSFILPDAILYAVVKRRQTQIRAALAQALDLMVLCVDAGLGLDATMQRISSEDNGLANALNEELSILGREIFLGMDRERAYQDLYLRTGVDELKTLGSALNQAHKLGLSVSKILRSQSEFIRKRQGQKAEEKAMKLPVYMAFPLWFFIMPSLMILTLAPSLIRFYHQLYPGS